MPSPAQRDREATESRLIAAVGELINHEGFGAVGVNALARQAGVDKVLIYRYFGGIPGLLAAYAEKGDFWWKVPDIVTDPFPNRGDPEGLVKALTLVVERHAQFLRSHPVTLEVIAWEMSDRNELTVALETVREERSIELMQLLAERFGIDERTFLRRLGPVLALLGAAANYLSARGRRLKAFAGVNPQSDDGWAMLIEAVGTMIAGAVEDARGWNPVDQVRGVPDDKTNDTEET